jgi:hypothetical protein
MKESLLTRGAEPFVRQSMFKNCSFQLIPRVTVIYCIKTPTGNIWCQ